MIEMIVKFDFPVLSFIWFIKYDHIWKVPKIQFQILN